VRKIIQLEDHFATGESTIQPVLLWGPGKSQLDVGHVTKTASDAIDYIKNVTPEPGKTHMLVLALGSEEAYGPNRNGDGFPERPINAKNGKGYWIKPGDELTKHYKSFETNPAHAFLHHANKDPAKASGHVKKAFWNDKMHRVELLIVVDNKKDPEWVSRVNDGEFPAVSMGCRIKYDVCSRCGNQAPTRAQYCEHVRNGMNQVNSDGTKNYVHNPAPNFFDISRVFRPADRTGYTLKKVAHVYELQSSAELGDVADDLDLKAAAIRKLSDIEKVIRGEPVASASNLAPAEQTLVRQFRDHSGTRLAAGPALPIEELMKYAPKAVLSTLESLGINLRSPEFIQYITSQLTNQPIMASLVHKTAAMLPSVYAAFEQSPSLFNEVVSTGLFDTSPSYINSELHHKLAAYAIKRAGAGELLYRRLVPEGIGIRPEEAPRTDLLNYQDPYTGQTAQTTRGAAIDADDAVTRSNLKKALGGGALMLGGYKLLSAFPSLRPYKLPLALGMGYAGYKALKPSQPPQYRTQEGFNIPDITEFGRQEKFSSDESIVAATVAAVEDYALRKHSSMSVDSNLVSRVKHASAMDGIKGIESNFDVAADLFGEVIVS